jgi:DNA-binding NtrC family response regulator
MTAILVADDDPSTRVVVADVLKRNGYNVLAVGGSAEALGIIEDGGQKLSLLLSDFSMPGLNGGDLAERSAALRPTLTIILMSGYQYEAVDRYLTIGRKRLAFLQKPFSVSSLIHQMRRVLCS